MRMTVASFVFLGILASTASAANWPQFRGPAGQGISPETNLPTKWDSQSNVAWKVEIPGLGWSSPIVWEDRVFVSTASADGSQCHLISLDRRTGSTVWDQRLLEQVPGHKEGKNSYATPTPVTEGKRVYAAFADGSLVAVDFDGNVVWTNREVKHYSRHGLGASPIVYEGRLIMAYDGSHRVAVAGQWPNNSDEERLGWQIPWDKAQIVALDTETGQRSWTARRGMSRVAHATPCVLREDGDAQLVSTAGDVIQGFDLKTGKRLWTVFSQGEGVVPSAVVGDGLIFTCSGFGATTIRAVRTGGMGDVTSTHIAWEQPAGTPRQASMLFVRPYLYGISDNGIAHCYAAKTGEVVWRQRIGGNHCASPVYAGGRIYFLSEEGTTTVVQAGAKFKRLATNPLNERCQASMAVSQGNLFIRTQNHLYCIGDRPQ